MFRLIRMKRFGTDGVHCSIDLSAISGAAAFPVRAAKAVAVLDCQNGNAYVCLKEPVRLLLRGCFTLLYTEFAQVQVLATCPTEWKGWGGFNGK